MRSEQQRYFMMSWWEKCLFKLKKLLVGIPNFFIAIFLAIPKVFKKIFFGIKHIFGEYFRMFMFGDMNTKLSYLVMGLGCIKTKQYARGIIYFVLQVGFFVYLVTFGSLYLSKLGTLGSSTMQEVWDDKQGIYVYTQGDNSMLILLYSVLTLFIIMGFIALYYMNIKNAYHNQKLVESGKKPDSFKEDLKNIKDKNFHTTLLTVPMLGLIVFTVMPLIFMVLIAFTNYDRAHQPPGNLFTWVGTQNFNDMLNGSLQLGSTFWNILGWTLVWAVFATVTNYIFGMLLAIMINKKGIKLKKFWRTIFVITIAVPQFVSLMLMSRLLHDQGNINILLQNLGLISAPLPFLTNPTWARITVIVVNMWVGIPYSMLITTGILMNIPSDLYEAATIDGANGWKMFSKITLPYMLFVTGPYLLTQFIGNLNNFNVIYLLTQGGPLSLDYYQAGSTDLLVTWLYKLSNNENNYKLASVVGILVFVISATFSLLVYNKSNSVKNEEDFQ